MQKTADFKKVRCLNTSGKVERVQFIPAHMTQDQSFMRRNQLRIAEPIKMEEIGKSSESIEDPIHEPEKKKAGRPKSE